MFYLQLHCVVQPDAHMKCITEFYPLHLTISLRFKHLENLIHIHKLCLVPCFSLFEYKGINY